jgi:S-layer protein
VSDVLNLGLTGNVGSVVAYGTVTAANVETVNITATDSATAGSAAAINTLTLAATGATSVVVTGNNGLTLTNTNNVLITNFNASGVVANGTATVDTAANLAVTFASANVTAAANVSITGGDGNDTLTGSIAKDTINGGAGIDFIYGDNAGTKAVNTVTVAAAADAEVLVGDVFTVTIDGIVSSYTMTTADVATATAAADVAAAAVGLAAAVNANASLKALVTATSALGVVTLTSLHDGAITAAITETSAAAGVTVSTATTTTGAAGTAAVDNLNGGAGADLIVGGGGADILTGGADADTFFMLKGHSTLAATATITDFTFATGGTSNDKLILGNQVAAIGTSLTVQDLSLAVSIQAAIDAAATTNIVDNGLSVFIFGGNEYAFVETTGSGTSYVTTDFLVKLTGLPLADGATIAGSGFDAV